MTVINTNISAIAAQNSLRVTGLAQTNAMERLSSGIRINSAKDDAAGLAISTRMTANKPLRDPSDDLNFGLETRRNSTN